MLSRHLFIFSFIACFSLQVKGFSGDLLKDIQISPADQKLARSVHEFLSDLRQKRLSPATLARVTSQAKTSYAFSDLYPLLQVATDIAKINHSSELFAKSCHHTLNNQEASTLSALQTRVLEDLKSYCRHTFYTAIKNKKISPQLDQEALLFLMSNLSFALNGEHQALFESILPELLSIKSQKEQLTNAIEELIIAEGLQPSSALLKTLGPSTKLTHYIQGTNALDTSAKRYFSEQAREMITEARKLIDKEQYDKVKEVLPHLVAFYQQNQNYLHQHYIWFNISSIGRSLLYNKQFSLSKEAFEYALHISTSAQLDDTRFYLLWVDIVSKQWKAAYQLIRDFKYVEEMENHSSKLKYWIARVLTQVGQRALASNIYYDIANNDPMSFYAILSLREISGATAARALAQSPLEGTRTPTSEVSIPTLTFSPTQQRALARLNYWLDLNLDQYSFLEINDLYNTPPLQSNGLSNEDYHKLLTKSLANFFNGRDKYLHTFRVLNSSLASQQVPLTQQVLEFLFPEKYKDAIQGVDKSIDPYVVLALIRQESAFNPTARSVAGARGLMQIMPATGRSLQRNLTIRQLYNTQTNLRLGIRYFKRLTNLYDGNLVLSLAAYNAGQGNVNSWRKNIFVFDDDPLTMIEMIPFKETRKYVKLIYRNIYFYNLLQQRSLLEAPFDETLRLGFYTQGPEKEGAL